MKKATDRARRKSIPHFTLIWTRFVTVNQNHKINLPFVRGTSTSHVPQQHKNLQLLLLGERICCHHVLWLILTEEDYC